MRSMLTDNGRYTKPEEYGIVTVPLPKLRENDVLIKVKACGVCGTDLHIHEGNCFPGYMKNEETRGWLTPGSARRRVYCEGKATLFIPPWSPLCYLVQLVILDIIPPGSLLSSMIEAKHMLMFSYCSSLLFLVRDSSLRNFELPSGYPGWNGRFLKILWMLGGFYWHVLCFKVPQRAIDDSSTSHTE